MKRWKRWRSAWKTRFTNSAVCDRETYVFGDAPRLIKLIRNNFLDSSFVLFEIRYVNSGLVTKFIQRNKSDLTTAHTL